MAKFWVCAAVGFYLLQLCAARIDLNISCRYAGVFHVEKNHRYSLTREDAVELCRALNSTIPTWEQMEKAFTFGFETCRYGYIEDKIVVPRHTPYSLCAANNTGIYILTSNISDRYDAYCFNSSEPRDIACDPVIRLYSTWPNNDSRIEIFNADGSRYVEGKKVTEGPPITDDDNILGSGSATGRGTADPNDITQEDDISTFTSTYGSDKDSHYHRDHYPGYPSEDQNSQSPTGEGSDHGKHHGNSSQDQQVAEDFPIWWPPEEHKGTQIAIVSEDESSEEDDDDDDDGGDDDDDGGDEEEGSGHINPETILEWDNSGDKGLQSSNTTMSSSKDVKREDSAHSSLLHDVHFGRDSEVRHSANGTSEDVLSGVFPLGDDEQYSTTTAVFSSDDFFKQEDSNQHRLHGAPPEQDDTVPTTISTSEVLHPEIVPSNEKESTLGKESFHHTALTSHDESKHKDIPQDLLPPDDQPIGSTEKFYPTNTLDEDLHSFISPSNVVPYDGMKHEESVQDSVLQIVYPDWSTDERNHTNISSKEMPPGIFPPNENDPKNESVHTAVVTNDDIDHEDSIIETLIHGIDPGLNNEDGYPTNISRDAVHHGIVYPDENEHEKEMEISQTAVVSTEAGDYEDSTQDLLAHPGLNDERNHPANSSINDLKPGISHPVEDVHGNKTSRTVVRINYDASYEDATHDQTIHKWNEEDKNLTNDNVPLGVITPTGNSNEEKIFHTVVLLNDHEDSTQQPLPPIHQPGWVSKEKPLTNTSGDGITTEIDKDHENEHDSLYTDVVYDGTKEESTPEPVRQWGGEDKYTTKATMDVLSSGIVPRRGINQKNKTYHTVVAFSEGDKNEESVLEPQWHPTWTKEDENHVNNTQDNKIPGIFPEIRSDSDKLPLPPDSSDPNRHFSGGHHTGNKDGTPSPGWSPESQKRVANIPDWLIVVASLLALALILGVCIAVNSRRRCGQKKKLVINNGKGGIDEKKTGGLNGEASKSQEMVHLVHKEKPEDQKGPHDEFLAIDETQNQQDVSLKSGM